MPMLILDLKFFWLVKLSIKYPYYGIDIKKAEPPIFQIFEDHGYGNGIHRKIMNHGMTFGENSL